MRGLLVVGPIVLAACSMTRASVTLTRLSTTPYPQQAASYPIPVFRETRPRCPLIELALATATRGDLQARGADPSALTEALRAKAREIGGDAIVGFSQEAVVTGAKEGVGDLGVSLSRTTEVSGTIVRFRDRSCTE